ncbi:MAG: ABC transporter substrate-binding protein [Firmicutes bacterium]|nr:ABC transporter substrate-binding protein [Bacillota bacterium]
MIKKNILKMMSLVLLLFTFAGVFAGFTAPPPRQNTYGFYINLYSPKTSFLQFNTNHEILESHSVRQAIAYAINNNELATVFYGTPTQNHLWGTNLPSYNPNLEARTPNIHRSIELLAEAGFSNETTLNLLVPLENEFLMHKAAIIHDMLRDIIIIDINTVSQEDFYTNLEQRTFDIAMTSMFVDNLYTLRELFVCDGILNYGDFQYTRITELFDNAFYETDPVSQQEMFFEIQEILSYSLPVLSLVRHQTITEGFMFIEEDRFVFPIGNFIAEWPRTSIDNITKIGSDGFAWVDEGNSTRWEFDDETRENILATDPDNVAFYSGKIRRV